MGERGRGWRARKDEPAATGPRAGSGRRVQTVWFPPIADDRYVADRVWERAVLDECPFHPGGGCGLLRHGSYRRVHPAGARVARFLCPRQGQTVSLLPAFLSARLPSTLDEVEAVVDTVDASSSIASAAEAARPADDEQAVTSISAVRWVRRRLRAVQVALLALVTLLPELHGCAPTLSALRSHLGTARVLVKLRELGRAHLFGLSPPLGLFARAGR
jgi:hypothetical protein